MDKLLSKMGNYYKIYFQPMLRNFGVDIIRYQQRDLINELIQDRGKLEIYNQVKPFTMTSQEKVNALIEAVNYVVKNNIEGAFVECGVWKGGSAMAMALTLKKLGDQTREIFLYDTFSGMNRPTELDYDLTTGKAAEEVFGLTKTSDDTSNWCFSSLEEVRKNVISSGYAENKLFFIEGKVEDTIPQNIPDQIALLRLDTDWYKSTRHELNYLFPLLKRNGIIIIDDYGCWAGAKKAVDEYIEENNICILLNRIDEAGGRIAIKT